MRINKLLIIFIILLLSFLTIIIFIFIQKNKGIIILYFNQKNVKLSINEKEYSIKEEKFEKKISPGKYKIEADKSGYEKYKREVIVKKGERVKLFVNFRPNKETEESIKKAIKEYIYKIKIYNNYQIEMVEIKNEYIKVKIYSTGKKDEPIWLVIKKVNEKWKVINAGTDIDLEETIKNEPKNTLIRSLPYISENFEVYYIDYLDQFYVIIKKEPPEKIKNEARKWFDNQGINRNQIVIRWSLSPVLIRK